MAIRNREHLKLGRFLETIGERHGRIVTKGLAGLVVVITASAVFAASARAADGTCDASVANQTALNAAIGCFNAETVAGNHIITITSDFAYTTSVVAIGNTTAGLSLQIDGTGNTVDADGNGRVFTVIAADVSFANITLTGGNATGPSPASSGGGIHVDSGALVTVTDSTISNNTALSNGGGISIGAGGLFLSVMTVSDSTISNNSSTSGGGISSGGVVTINDSTISSNTASLNGGGIQNIFNTLTVNDSTVSGNSASSSGGGIHNALGIVTVNDSTISSNTASSSGGGVFNHSSGRLNSWFSTITANQSADGAGIWTGADGTFTFINVGASIIADNLGAGGDVDCRNGFCAGNGFTSFGFNVVGDGNATPSFNATQDSVIGAGAGLGPLLNNGGPTETHLPGFGSPAVDRFNITTGLPAWDQAFDQRGVARPQGPFKDAGSVERERDGLSLVSPVCGVYDSLMAGDPALPGSGVPKTVQVSGECGVPAGASAVVVTVTSKSPSGVGNLRVSAAGVVPSGGVVNYTANGLDQSNTVTVPLSAGGALDVAANNGDSHFRVVVAGFYSQAGVLAYSGVAPCAAADSRSSQNPAGGFVGPFSAGPAMPDVDVVGVFSAGQGGGNTDCGVPAGVAGVVVNIVSIGGSGGNGGVAAGEGGTSPVEPTVNYAPIGLNNAAVTYLPVDGSGKIAVDVIGAGMTHIRIVVLGYLTTTGDDYTPVNPCNAFDSRDDLGSDPDNVPTGLFAGKRIAGDALTGTVPGTTTYNVTGGIPAGQGGASDCGVPVGASAVLINLVAIQPDAVGNFRAYATGSIPTGGVLNFTTLIPPVNNVNAVVVPVSALGNIDLFVNSPSNVGLPTVHARGVILGFYD